MFWRFLLYFAIFFEISVENMETSARSRKNWCSYFPQNFKEKYVQNTQHKKQHFLLRKEMQRNG